MSPNRSSVTPFIAETTTPKCSKLILALTTATLAVFALLGLFSPFSVFILIFMLGFLAFQFGANALKS
jgi:hypothetical protein